MNHNLHTESRIYIKDCNLKYQYCNKYFCKDKNMKFEAVIGKSDSDIFENNADYFQSMDQKVLSSNKDLEFQHKYIISGEHYTADHVKSPYKDKNGKITGIIGTINIKSFDLKKIELLSKAQLAANIASWEYDINSGKTYRTENLKEITGFRTGEMVNTYEDYLKIIHPDDIEEFNRKFNETIKNGTDFQMTYRIITPDKKINYISGSGFLERDNLGNPSSVYGIHRNITEKIENEKKIILFKSAIDISLTATVLADRSGYITYINNALLNLWEEEKKDNIIGKSVLLLGKDPKEVKEIISEINKTGSWFGEISATRKNNTKFNALLNARAVKNDKGEIIQYIASVLNTTDHDKKIEETTIEQIQYDTLIKSMQFGYWLIDTEGQFIDFNDQLLNMLGYSEREIRQKNVFDIRVENYEGETKHIIQYIFNVGNFVLLGRLRKKNGKIITVESTVSYWKSRNLLIGFTKEIPETDKIDNLYQDSQNELRELKTALKIILDTKGNDTSYVKHDLSDNRSDSYEHLINQMNQIENTNQIRFTELFAKIKEKKSIPNSFVQDLTVREQKTAILICQGFTSKEIGEKLIVSARTVENYRNSIRKKLGLTRKSQNLRDKLIDILNED